MKKLKQEARVEIIIDIFKEIFKEYVRRVNKAAQQEAGPRSKRHPKSVEGLGVKGEGEQ